ncbi:MAG TPA: GTPase [Pirellula sp.]|nr:GTPase [Pirellula sp.]
MSLTTPTTVSRLTSVVPSAISVLEVNGPLALDFVKRGWCPNRGDTDLQINAIRFGHTQFDGISSGESIIVCRTAKNCIEVHCHGGRLASHAILRGLISFGAVEQPAKLRCPVDGNGEIASEACEDLLRASTLQTTTILLDQMRGALARELDSIRTKLIAGNMADATASLKQLSHRSRLGSHLIEPWRVVLAGPPNAGKSSLLNMILGYARAIVHEQAGTTRDLLAEHTSFAGWPIELIDGAGIRASTDAIEATGIDQTLERIASADCTLLLVDSTTGWTDTHNQILDCCSGKVVLVITKSDLTSDFVHNIPMRLPSRVETSSVTGAGLKELIEAVVSFLVPQILCKGDPVPFRQRHRDAIEVAIDSIRRNEIETAFDCLHSRYREIACNRG